MAPGPEPEASLVNTPGAAVLISALPLLVAPDAVERISTVAAVFGAAFRNPDLRNLGFAYALFSASEIGIWIVLLVYAFARGGASAELTIILVQLVPCVVLAPVIGALLWPVLVGILSRLHER